MQSSAVFGRFVAVQLCAEENSNLSEKRKRKNNPVEVFCISCAGLALLLSRVWDLAWWLGDVLQQIHVGVLAKILFIYFFFNPKAHP